MRATSYLRVRLALAALIAIASAVLYAFQAPGAATNVRINAALTSVTNPISPSRLPSGSTTLPEAQWAAAGAGAIPTRTRCTTGTGTSQLASTSTAAQINTAITGCDAGHYVELGAGTFTISAAILLNANISLRVQGADQTILSCGANGQSGWVPPVTNVCVVLGLTTTNDGESCCTDAGGSFLGTSVIGTYTKGATSILLGTISKGNKPQVGNGLALDQLNDATARASDTWPDIFDCMKVGTCDGNGGTGDGPPDDRWDGSTAASSRTQFQTVKVTSITGGTCTDAAPCTVGITPGLRMPNWRTSQTPQWFGGNAAMPAAEGVEHLRVTTSTATPVGFHWCAGCWMKGVQADSTGPTDGGRAVSIWDGGATTIRDSYIFGPTTGAGGDNYCLAIYGVGSDILIENNIIAFCRANLMMEGANNVVAAYNYFPRQINTPNSWNYSGSADNHATGASFWLLEGNEGFGVDFENVHGNVLFATLFRNRYYGQDALPTSNQTVPVMNYGLSRHGNFIGNVLGLSSYHTKYQSDDTTITSCVNSIYALGLGGDCAHGSGGITDDAHTKDSIFRWGNWDVVSGSGHVTSTNDQVGVKYDSTEVPSGLALFSNAVPSSHSLPSSMYLSGTPAYFTFTSVPFPAIGPDVSSGNITNSGGHANKIPAHVCGDSLSIAFADTTPKTTFNALTCYGS